MKRKQTTLFAAALICVAVFASCSSEPELVAPNPGFGIHTIGLDENGIVHPLPGSRTTGHLTTTPFTGQIIIPSGASGHVGQFDVTTNSRSKAIVPDGIAPAFWTVKGESGWTYFATSFFGPPEIKTCDGKLGVMAPKPGKFSELVCRELFGVSGSMSPSTVNVSEAAVEFEMAADRVDTTYGMPTVQFYDPYGTYVAQTTATSVDPEYGVWAKGWTHCLAGLPAGTYKAELLNRTWNGVGERIGVADVYLYGAGSTNYIDDNQFFVAQQYRDFLGREPDQSGLDFWTGTITQCSNLSYREPGESYAQCIARKRVNVSLAFWASGEFQQLHPEVVNQSDPGAYDNYQFVRLCHVLYLRREPTQAEIDFWLGNLIGWNNDYYPVVKGFINSDEYRLRFEPPPQPICDPTWQEVENCQWSGGWWDYSYCTCSWGGMY